MPDEPMIDGVPISEIIKIADGIDNPGWGGCYMRAEAVSEREYKSRRKFTVWVSYPDLFEAPSEEIDVIASDDTDAQTIAELVLLWHYEPGGKVHSVQEWPEGVTFHHFY
jgi:hypothetical protein